jgi:hypothetical protein
MSKHNNCCPDEKTGRLTMDLNITKIVKYACVAGVLIVAIIFGTKTFEKMIENTK